MPADLKQLMDDALSDLRLPPGLVSESIRRHDRRKQRGRIVAGMATAAAIAVSAILLWSVGGSSHSGQSTLVPISSAPPASGPARYVATGTLLTDPKHGEPLNLCGAVALSLPPQCSLIPLRGVDVNTLPSVRTLNGVTWTDKSFRVVGTYSGGILTATQKPQLAPVSSPPREPDSEVLPCSPPPGGWTNHTINAADETALDAYGTAHPDTFGGIWLSDDQRVIVVSTTGDLATARQEIRRTYTDNLCVTKADYTGQFLQAATDRLNAPAITKSLGIIETSVDTVESRIDVQVVIDNQTVTDYVTANFPAGLVRVTSFLVPVQ